MSAARPLRAWSTRVAGWLAPARPRARGRASVALVGHDLGARRSGNPPFSRFLPAALAGVLLAALALAALRVDLIRVRYGMGEAMREEKELLEQGRSLRARVGSLRDPSRLARLAPRYALARPARVLDLPGRPPQDPHR